MWACATMQQGKEGGAETLGASASTSSRHLALHDAMGGNTGGAVEFLVEGETRSFRCLIAAGRLAPASLLLQSQPCA